MSVILKCKICGGDIELNSEQTIGTCMYCGSQLTLPKIADTQRIDAFNRGNHFRRIGEFDNALTIYEQIINEDKTDAEAHWCAAISRFGIEYVEDPSTMEYIPTCHRASFDSFLDDVDYKAAIEFSEGVTRRQYQKDGMRIDEVQKAILSTSQKEDPFDVFICYKEADAVGERTQDSVLAQDIYERLSEKGYRVFFSRITLEEKVGTEFEPYIFAALNSAKVMVVVGTSRQNLDSVWVKNEWGRFLALMKKDNSKVILPCYKDIDPYEMPEGLAVLQSYNMASIGFIQDLIRGIEKIVNPAQQLQQHTTFSSIDVNALKKRIRVFLDNKDFKSANEYCNKVLDALPEDGETYALKLCSEVGVSNVDKLCKSRRSFDNKTSYTNAVKFGDKELRSLLESQNSVVRAKEKKKRNRIRLTAVIVVVITIISASLVYLTPRVIIPEYNKYKAYQDGKRLLKDKDYTEAYKTFVSLGEYKNSSDMAKEVMYVKASDCMDNADYDQAISIWETIPEYKDSLDLIEAAEEAKYDSTYQEAIAAMGKQDYETAVELFKEVNEYKDAKTKIIECKYQQAKAVFDDKDYDEA